MVNPFRSVWLYWEKTGVRRDLPVMKRLMVEAPHMVYGGVLSVAAMVIGYSYVRYIYDYGLGYQSRYTVMRSDDERVPKFKKEVINADQYASK